jgi:Flp pilus assembly protein CpaB
MNGKALIPLVAGLGIGGFALWMGFNTLKSARGAQQPVASVTVWAAQTDIPRGTEITEEMVHAVSFPAQLVPKGALKEKEQVIGRVPRLDAPAGLPILEDMLLAKGARAGIYVKPGFRAVAVKIDESSGVDYHLEPGSFVDVVGSFNVRTERGQETLARTLVENVEVAAVGPRLSVVRDKAEAADEKTAARTVRAITLFVQPDDVPKLLLAEQKGRIKLSLRNDADGGKVSADGRVSEQQLWDRNAAAPAEKPAGPSGPAKPGFSIVNWMQSKFAPGNGPGLMESLQARLPRRAPAQPWEVSVYRGQTRETVRFRSRDSREQAPANPAPPASATPAPSAPPPSAEASPTPAPADPAKSTPDVPSEPKEPHE